MLDTLGKVCASCYGELGNYYLAVNIARNTHIGLCEKCIEKALVEIKRQKRKLLVNEDDGA